MNIIAPKDSSSIFDLDNHNLISGKEINNYSEKLSFQISKKGLENNYILIFKNPLLLLVALNSVWNLGSCAIVLSPNYSLNAIQNISEKTNTNIIISDVDIFSKIVNIRTINFSSLSDLVSNNLRDLPKINNIFDKNALILFTSGTTGEPKGVVHTYRSLLNRLISNEEHFEEYMFNTYAVLPLHFGHGLIGVALTCLFSGNNLYLSNKTSLEKASNIINIIENYDITFISTVPSFWQQVLKFSKDINYQNKELRIHIGSAPLGKSLVKKIQKLLGTKEIYNLYGITEVCNYFSIQKANDDFKDGEIGVPLSGKFSVLRDGKLCFDGSGEIAIISTSTMKGYFGRKDLNSKSFLSGWFLTGDYGEIKNKQVRLLGRLKNEINFGGFKVHPEDIDLVLESNEEISESCTIGIENEIYGEIPITILSLQRQNSQLSKSKLLKFLAESYKSEGLPTKFYITESIKKNERGKVDRNIVRLQFLNKEFIELI